MNEYNINRRQMIRMSSLAALSTVATPAVAVTKSTSPDIEGSKIDLTKNEICFSNALDLAALLRKKKISAREVMQAHLQQIKNVNPKVNAMVTMVPEDQLMAEALAADESLAKGNLIGPLHGLPIAVKDLMETKGIRTTSGSPLYKDLIPSQDSLIVEREKKAGAIVIGKSNVPELGLGSQTFNPIFGPTFNPYDTSKTCGGSTGGGAVALACGMTPLADGSGTWGVHSETRVASTM